MVPVIPFIRVLQEMYHELREVFLWDVLEKDIAEFVAKRLNCQQVKAEHQKTNGLLQEK